MLEKEIRKIKNVAAAQINFQLNKKINHLEILFN